MKNTIAIVMLVGGVFVIFSTDPASVIMTRLFAFAGLVACALWIQEL